MTEAEILTQYTAWCKLVNDMTDQEILDHLRDTEARGLDPWWQRRLEYLEKAGREHLILKEGLLDMQDRAAQLSGRSK